MPIDEIGGQPQRFPEIDKKHHARVLRAIPRLVFVGIIENHNLPLAPAVDFVLDPDAEHLAWLRHDQSKVEPQHGRYFPAPELKTSR